MQARLHNQTQIEMQASRSLIANVTSSARGLHEVVDDAAAKIAKMAWFGAVQGDLFKLAWLALAVTVLHWYSPRHAVFVATAIGGFPKTTETSMLIGSHRNYDIDIRLWLAGQHQVNPFGPSNHPLRIRLPSPFLDTHQICCGASRHLSNRRRYLPAHPCFQSLTLPQHLE